MSRTFTQIHRPAVAPQRGLTLIEMMVTLVIGLVLSLAIFMVLSAGEGRKRTATSVNDINQAGAYGLYVLDKMVRGAGSGFAQSGDFAYGCTLYATNGVSQILPVASLPAPFAAVNPTGTAGVFRLAPVVIVPGQTTPNISGQPSDVLIVMGGSAGLGEYPVAFRGHTAAGTLDLPNTVGFGASDIVLIAQEDVSSCMVQQVASPFTGGTANLLPLAGAYAADTIGTASIANYKPDDGTVMNLGNIANGNTPSFLLIGVGDNNTLSAYNLLQSDSAAGAATALVDGVFELHALYGTDLTNTGTLTWTPPTGSYSPASLLAGTPAAAQLLQSIKAVRVGLIMRSSLLEKAPVPPAPPVAPATLSLFRDLYDSANNSLELSRALTDAERNYRYRTIETTIPLRNHLN